MTLSVVISLAVFILIISVANKLFNIIQSKPKYMKKFLAFYGFLLVIATIYVGFIKSDVIMTKAEKTKIVDENKDFTSRATQHQLKGKEEAFFVESFRKRLKGDRINITSNADRVNIYVERIAKKSNLIEVEVYHSNDYYHSINLTDEISYPEVKWRSPMELHITERKMTNKRYSVLTDSDPMFSFNPSYFKGYSQEGYSTFLGGYTIVNLKVPQYVKITDPDEIVWQPEK